MQVNYKTSIKSAHGFHPVETRLIQKLETKSRKVVETYQQVLERTDCPEDKTKFRSILRNHLLSWDYWKRELDQRDALPTEKIGLKSRFYQAKVKLMSLWGGLPLYFALRGLESINMTMYSRALSCNYVCNNMKRKIRRLFIIKSRKNIKRMK